MANAADAMAAIKKLVFEEEALTLAQLAELLLLPAGASDGGRRLFSCGFFLRTAFGALVLLPISPILHALRLELFSRFSLDALRPVLWLCRLCGKIILVFDWKFRPQFAVGQRKRVLLTRVVYGNFKCSSVYLAAGRTLRLAFAREFRAKARKGSGREYGRQARFWQRRQIQSLCFVFRGIAAGRLFLHRQDRLYRALSG
ncbi:MAG: hypothetical protein LBL83_03665 [Clostridiales bacterium]|nr:hypothetical protein [Clostridiales bacterium]